MSAKFGQYFWWSVGILVISAATFFTSHSGPHLRAGPTSSSTDPTQLISGIVSLITAITALVGAIQKVQGNDKPATLPPDPKPFQPDPTRVQNDYPDQTRRPARREYVAGEIVEFVRVDPRDDRVNLVEVRRFAYYDGTGDEHWKVIREFREWR